MDDVAERFAKDSLLRDSSAKLLSGLLANKDLEYALLHEIGGLLAISLGTPWAKTHLQVSPSAGVEAVSSPEEMSIQVTPQLVLIILLDAIGASVVGEHGCEPGPWGVVRCDSSTGLERVEMIVESLTEMCFVDPAPGDVFEDFWLEANARMSGAATYASALALFLQGLSLVVDHEMGHLVGVEWREAQGAFCLEGVAQDEEVADEIAAAAFAFEWFLYSELCPEYLNRNAAKLCKRDPRESFGLLEEPQRLIMEKAFRLTSCSEGDLGQFAQRSRLFRWRSFRNLVRLAEGMDLDARTCPPMAPTILARRQEIRLQKHADRSTTADIVGTCATTDRANLCFFLDGLPPDVSYENWTCLTEEGGPRECEVTGNLEGCALGDERLRFVLFTGKGLSVPSGRSVSPSAVGDLLFLSDGTLEGVTWGYVSRETEQSATIVFPMEYLYEVNGEAVLVYDSLGGIVGSLSGVDPLGIVATGEVQPLCRTGVGR